MLDVPPCRMAAAVTRGPSKGAEEDSQMGIAGGGARPTSDDAEKLLDAQAGIDAVEEPLHVAAPAAQCAAGLRGCGSGGAILQEHLAQPANHPLDPLWESTGV